MLQKICNALSTIIVFVLLAMAGALLLPSLIGYKNFVVLSGSMTPEIGVGSVVYAGEVEFDELEVGDIITYNLGESTVVTHRIVEMNQTERNVITRGDANNVNDGSPVSESQIIGRVDFHIPYLGYISMYMKTALGIAVICGVAVVMIILNMLPELFKKEEKKDEENKAV